MKKLFLITTSLLIISKSFALSITAIKNGSWTSGPTWSNGSGPVSGDSIIIPNSIIVSINTNVNTGATYYIQVYGTLSLTGSGSKLSISSSSTIYVYASGSINGTSSPSQTIKIGGNEVYNAGKDINVVPGPSYANSATSGFVGLITLPVKFVGFSVSETVEKNIMIQWSTSEEVNSYTYEVERSYDGNNWNTIAYILGAGNSKVVNSYSYIDKNSTSNTIYYRIKEIDINGAISYTSIKSFKFQNVKNPEAVKILAYNHSIILQFSDEIKGNILVRYIAFNGQIISQQTICQPIGQVILNPTSTLKGNFIISVSNGQDLQVAKQIIL